MTKPWSDIPSQNVTARSRRSETGWDDHASMPRVSSGKRPGGAGTGWPCGPTIPPPLPSKPPIGRGNGRPPRNSAARECAAIQQALQTRALADQCWELHALIDDVEPGRGHATLWSRRAAHRSPGRCERQLLWEWPRRACAGIGGRSSAWRTSGPPGAAQAGALERRGRRQRTGVCASPSPQGPCGDPVRGTWRARPANVRRPLAQN